MNIPFPGFLSKRAVFDKYCRAIAVREQRGSLILKITTQQWAAVQCRYSGKQCLLGTLNATLRVAKD